MTRSLQLTEDFTALRDQQLANQLRVISEKAKGAEADAQRYRAELQAEKEQSFRRLQDLEGEKVRLRTESAISQEKLQQARLELEDVRLRLNAEFTEKLRDLETQSRSLRDDLKRKDAHILELTNDSARASSETGKLLALVEQERDFLRRDLQAAKETAQRREGESSDVLRMAREKEEKIKAQRAKKKALAREIAELRSQLSHAASTTLDESSLVAPLRSELESLRLERGVLLNQLETTQTQRDENKRLYETLLQVLNGQ